MMFRISTPIFLCSWLAASLLFGETPKSAPPLAVAPFDASQAKTLQEAWAAHVGMPVQSKNSQGTRMVLLPPGKFAMGSSAEQMSAALRTAEELKVDDSTRKRISTESPQHAVTIDKPLLMAATEVTIDEFGKFIEATGYETEAERYGSGNSVELKPATGKDKNEFDWRFPGFKQQGDQAVSQVSWNDAVEFCNWLSAQEKLTPAYELDEQRGWILQPEASGYRLPTEAEWEYAARAGTTTQYHYGDDVQLLAKYAWFGFKSGSNPLRVVGSKLPNAFGLYDMHGNIGEWCQDVYRVKSYPKHTLNPPADATSAPQRVIRGGDWWTTAPRCRAAFRGYGEQSNRSDDLGFRVVRPAMK